jgi:hypothetical protein
MISCGFLAGRCKAQEINPAQRAGGPIEALPLWEKTGL